MSNGIIDILSQVEDQSAYFVVNVAVNYVNMVVPAGFSGLMSRADGKSFFKLLDNFVIISIGCYVPLDFTFWDNVDAGAKFVPPIVDLNFKEEFVGAETPLVPPSIYLPFSSYEMSYGRFFLVTEMGFGDRFQLNFRFTHDITQRISMINVPAALQGLTFFCPLFAKIEHTLEMEAV